MSFCQYTQEWRSRGLFIVAAQPFHRMKSSIISAVLLFLWVAEVSAAEIAALAPVAAQREEHPSGVSQATGFTVVEKPDRLLIEYSRRPVAEYVFGDEMILRPFFANLHEPGGIQVTRRHPPVRGRDATDHERMHPGVWLAFGDINGHDFWRNKAVVQHQRFLQKPASGTDRLTFRAENRLKTAEGKILGSELSRVVLTVQPGGYLLIWESVFIADQSDLSFGDQEEMGLGVRVATEITEKNGGVLTSSNGAKTAKGTWGKAFEWCDYSGVIGDRCVGVTLMTDPANFRASWFHNRDYGLMVANPFGRNAMKQGDPSTIQVSKGERLRLCFGVFLHSSPVKTETNVRSAYVQFLEESDRLR